MNEELSDEQLIERAKASGHLIQILPGKWTTPQEARRWFAGGTIISDTDASSLANQLRQMADNLDHTSGLG